MIMLMNYNFCSDINALDPMPTSISNIDSTKIQNGIYDYMNITENISFNYSTVQPTDWDFETIFNANFNGNISGGNVSGVGTGVTQVRVKRRIQGTFDWTTIYQADISQPEQLSFIYNDYLNLNNTEYEYAFVPVTNGVEGNYIIDSVMSKYNGVFICDATTIFNFMIKPQYGQNSRVQQIGVFQPYNRQYPVVVANGQIDYETGSIQGMVIPHSFYETGILNRQDVTQQKEAILQFLTNKKPKVIKDWNNNAWLCFITDNVNVTYDNNWGMGAVNVQAGWTEIGDISSNHDLYEAGLIPTED